MQEIDPYKPVKSNRVGPAPLVIRMTTTPNADHVMGGVPQTTQKNEQYVLLSALPPDLQQKVVLSIQMLMSGQ